MSDHQIASGAQFAPTFSLQSRTALVTGASRGIGWAAAALRSRGAGRTKWEREKLNAPHSTAFL